MNKIKQWFENDDEYYNISEDNGRLDVTTDIVYYLIIKPHTGTNNKWMLRVAAKSAFDRWANSTAIEKFFDTDIELCDYLRKNQLKIYKCLLKYISLEYEEIENKLY